MGWGSHGIVNSDVDDNHAAQFIRLSAGAGVSWLGHDISAHTFDFDGHRLSTLYHFVETVEILRNTRPLYNQGPMRDERAPQLYAIGAD